MDEDTKVRYYTCAFLMVAFSFEVYFLFGFRIAEEVILEATTVLYFAVLVSVVRVLLSIFFTVTKRELSIKFYAVLSTHVNLFDDLFEVLDAANVFSVVYVQLVNFQKFKTDIFRKFFFVCIKSLNGKIFFK